MWKKFLYQILDVKSACSLISEWTSEKPQNKEIAVYDLKDDALTPMG